MTVEVIRSFAGFAALRTEWNGLAEKQCTPLLWHEWLFACACSLHEERGLHVIVQREGGRLTAGAPLVVSGSGRRTRLEFLGVRALGEPSGFVFEDQAALECLLRGTCGVGLPLDLSRLPTSGPIEAAIVRAAAGRAIVIRRPSAPSLAVQVRRDSDAFERAFPSRLRSDLRRARRRAAAVGPVEECFLSPQPGEVLERVHRFERLEAAGWKGLRRSSLLHKENLRRFFASMGEQMARRRALRIGFLSIGGQDAAGVIGLEAHGRAWVLKVGYDERWARVSPGLLLMDAAMKDAGARGLVAFEFLGSAEQWQERWNTERRLYRAAALYPRSVEGLGALAMDLSGAAFRRLNDHLALGRRKRKQRT